MTGSLRPTTHAEWLHALRNAVNAATIATAAARSALETGNSERAAHFLRESESAGARASALLRAGIPPLA